MDYIGRKSKTYWDRPKAVINKLVARTPFEPVMRRAWWRLQSINRPYMRRAIDSDVSIEHCLHRVLQQDSNCLDVGCHKGHILQHMVHHAPLGTHLAFEPIPELAQDLRENVDQDRVFVHELALGNFNGQSKFYQPIIDAGFSGLRRQTYPDQEQAVQEFFVNVRKLDDVLPNDFVLDVIKIDVEGAEMMVLQGAANTIRRDKPVVVFEHGLEAAATFGFTSEMIYDLITKELDLRIFLLSDWLTDKHPLNAADFVEVASKRHGDFLAHL